MIIAIAIGRGGSVQFTGKNSYKVCGRPLMAYPILAAKECRLVDKVFFSSEDEELKRIARCYEAEIIDRPKELATDEALGEDVFVHAYKWVIGGSAEFQNERFYYIKGPEFLVLLFANAPCINSKMMEEMILKLRDAPDMDSICTISKCNAYSPYRLRICENGLLYTYLPEHEMEGSCDRDSAGDFYIYDCSCAVVRPHCLEDIESGFLPQRWLGKHVLYYKQDDDTPACDVDGRWQLGQVEHWLKVHYRY